MPQTAAEIAHESRYAFPNGYPTDGAAGEGDLERAMQAFVPLC